jgi:hypothetical protein
VRKARHIIESSKFITIVFTDHVAVKHIAYATTLKSASPERSNMRLIRAGQYLSQFKLDVRYRPGKDNIPADALSRLKRVVYNSYAYIEENDIIPEEPIDENTRTIIHVSTEFLTKWNAALLQDRHLYAIYSKLFPKLTKDVESIEEHGWVLKCIDKIPLLYLRKDDGLRACVPDSLHREVLEIAHDKQGHPGIERTYATLHQHLYIRQMSNVVRKYIAACPECLRKKTLRHAPYGSLQPIEPPVKPFEVITIDFVVKLPASISEGQLFDSVLTSTDKTT